MRLGYLSGTAGCDALVLLLLLVLSFPRHSPGRLNVATVLPSLPQTLFDLSLEYVAASHQHSSSDPEFRYIFVVPYTTDTDTFPRKHL